MTEFVLFAHILVFVYWLGGDLGAFVSASILVDEKQAPPARLAAAKLVAHIDMAPRMGLIFAFPTGFALALGVGWLSAPGWAAPAAWAGALIWAVMAWMIHLKTGPQGLLKPLDLAIRLAVIAALVLAAGAALAGVIDAPVFIALKYLLLAAAVACGLLIRAALAPFFQVVGALAAGTVTHAQNARVRQALGRVRLIVLVIWALISAAALLGVYTPAL